MGDPKKSKKKYSGPIHPWQKGRIDEERVLMREYAVKNKKEIWKMKSMLRGFASQAKKLVSLTSQQAEKEERQLLKRLKFMGLLAETATLSDVLGLTTKGIFERRLQTLVFRKGLANSIKQARQFIVHGHINVKGKKVSSPSYIIKSDEERHIEFSPSSALANEEHAERKSAKEKAAKAPKPAAKPSGEKQKERPAYKREDKKREDTKRGYTRKKEYKKKSGAAVKEQNKEKSG